MIAAFVHLTKWVLSNGSLGSETEWAFLHHEVLGWGGSGWHQGWYSLLSEEGLQCALLHVVEGRASGL